MATPPPPAARPSPSGPASNLPAPARRAPGPAAVAKPDLRVWLDPRNAIAIVREVAAVLSRADSRNAARYRRNAAVVIVRIETLDAGLGPRLLEVRRARYAAVNNGLQYLEDHYLLAPAIELNLPDGRLAPAALRKGRARLTASGLPCVVATARFVSANGRGIADRTGARIAVLDTYGEAAPPGPDAYFRIMRALGDRLMVCLGQKTATR